jgi:hypothetical protein
MNDLQKKAASLLSALLFLFVIAIISTDISTDRESADQTPGNIITGAATSTSCPTNAVNPFADANCLCDMVEGGEECKPGEWCVEVKKPEGTEYNCMSETSARRTIQNAARDATASSEIQPPAETKKAPNTPNLQLTSPAPTEVRRENACEAHVEFAFSTPDGAPNTWSLSQIVSGNAGIIDEFLERTIAYQMTNQVSMPVYVHGFSSYEGGTAINNRLASQRADAVVRLLNERIAQLAPQLRARYPDFDPAFTVGQAQRGTVRGKTDEFWPLSQADKRAINRVTGLNNDQRAALFGPIQPLRENRRGILTFGSAEYSIVPISTGLLDTGGCPPVEPPAPDENCGNLVVDPGEECDIQASLTECNGQQGTFTCGEPGTPDACKCVAEGQTGQCTANGVRDAGEECDPDSPTNTCGDGKTCNDQCKCQMEDVSGMCGTYYWKCILPLLLLLLLIPWAYRTRRHSGKQREAATGKELKEKREICIFLASIVQKENDLMKAIRELEEKVHALTPEVRNQFADYIKKFRDVAYLRDLTSPESQCLDKAGAEIKEIFKDYLELVVDLLEFEKLKATVAALCRKLRKGVEEYKANNGVSLTFNELGIKLDAAEVEMLEKRVLPDLEQHTQNVLTELRKIEITMEEHVREMGLGLSGIVSFFGKGRWERKFKQQYGADGEKAYQELWWVKHGLRGHAPIYMRSEDMIRTGERHRWPFNKMKWKGDLQVTTLEGSDEEKKWKERAEKIWGPGQDPQTKSAYIQKIGADIVANIEQDRHMLDALFRIEHINTPTTSQMTGLAMTGHVKGLSQGAMFAHGLKYGGHLQMELESIIRLIELICEGRLKPLEVKIDAPAHLKITAEKLDEIMKNKESFKATIKGGAPVFKHTWHWGPHTGDLAGGIADQIGNNFTMNPLWQLTPDNGKERSIEFNGGFSALSAFVAKTPHANIFNQIFSVDNKSQRYTLHISVVDTKGNVAHDSVIIDVSGNNVIEGRVVSDENPKQGIPDAEVWVKHSQYPDGRVVVDYVENNAIVIVHTDKDGNFKIQGKFMHHIIVYAKKEDVEGWHTLKPNGKPDGVIHFAPGVKHVEDVVVPIKGKTAEPLSVKIITPKPIKITSSQIAETMGSKEDFTAKLTGGISPYTFMWHLGNKVGEPTDLGGMLGDNIPVNTKTMTGKKGTMFDIVIAQGFMQLSEHARRDFKLNHPFADPKLSVDGEGKKFLLFVTAQDGAGKIAHDQIVIEIEKKPDEPVTQPGVPKVIVLPTVSPKEPHPPERGTRAKKPSVKIGERMDIPGEETRGGPYAHLEIDFLLRKEEGERRIGWVCYIQRLSDHAIMDPAKFKLRIVRHGGNRIENPYSYESKKYKYNWFDLPKKAVTEQEITFNPYIDIPEDAQPGDYNIVMEICGWPSGILPGVLKSPPPLLASSDAFREEDKKTEKQGFENIDMNFVTFNIEAPPKKEPVKITGKVVDLDNTEKAIPNTTVWLKISDSPNPKPEEMKYYLDEKGKILTAKSVKDGTFTISGFFGSSYILVLAKTKTGDGEGYHTLMPAGRPEKIFQAEKDVEGVIVPIVFPPKKTPFEKPPAPIDHEIMENLDKIALVEQGKIGAEKIPEGVRGIGNHVKKVIDAMQKEIDTHVHEVAKVGAKKYSNSPNNPSIPYGLDDFSKGRFFGYIKDDKSTMSIVNLAKVVHGSGKEILIDWSGKGLKYQTKGIGVKQFVTNIFAGNIEAIQQYIRIIEEKQELFKKYSAELTSFEERLNRLSNEAAKVDDEELLTVYENMKTCFANIRNHLSQHSISENLEIVKMELEGVIEFTGAVKAKSNPQVDEIVHRIIEWQHTPESGNPYAAWKMRSEELEGLFSAVLKEIQKNVLAMRQDIYGVLPVLSQNYHAFTEDLQLYNKIQEDRAQAKVSRAKVA